jgi:S1-C subfamily serine protease
MLSKIFRALLVFCFTIMSCKQEPPIPEKIIESVVFVNLSSGIVVYSDENSALVLTAYHVIADGTSDVGCSGCESDDNVVRFMYTIWYPGMKGQIVTSDPYKIISVGADIVNDLALLEIKPKEKLSYSKLSSISPDLGDDIWIGANPNGLYRSLKKGIISAKKHRFSESGAARLWEISGGVINGSSGGGIFNMKGDLIGIIDSVGLRYSDQCYDKYNSDANILEEECIIIPMTFTGFVTPIETVRKFILSTPFGKYFDYLN